MSNLLYWRHETSLYRPNGISEGNISFHGSCDLSQNIFELYVSEFIEKYRNLLVRRTPTEIIHPSANISEYCTLVTLNINPHTKIEYPGCSL
jgi:hypothetical protein